MGFAELLDQVGGFGRFQWIHVTLLSIPGLLMASQNVMNNFAGGMPGHHCNVPNRTSIASSHNISLSEVDDRRLLRAFIPVDASGEKLSRCTRYVEAQWHLLDGNVSALGPHGNGTEPETETCLDGWTYERTEFLETIVSEWDLVCTLRPLKQMVQTVYMGGFLVGAIIYGGLADRYGRRTVLIWSYLQLAVVGSLAALAQSYLAYCALRFLVGMATAGISLNTVSLQVEWIPTRTRTLVGPLSSFCFTLGQMVLAGVAYSLRDWRKLQVAVCAPFFLVFAYSWWYSESARWLVLSRRSAEALKHIHRVARINGRPEMAEKITLEVLESHMRREVQSNKSSHTASDLFRTPVMRRISVCLVAVGFSVAFSFYGLILDLQKFGSNIYLTHVFFALIDFPAKFLVLGMLGYLGRRATQSSCLILSSLTVLANTLVPSDMQTCRTIMACLGKGFIAASFTCINLYIGELYPTVIRQRGLGFVSTMARVGGMAAPAVLMLDEVLPPLPSLVYGGAGLIAGGLACFLPETLDVPLPDTIHHVEERWGKVRPGAQEEQEVQKKSLALQEMKDVAGAEDDGKATGLNAL